MAAPTLSTTVSRRTMLAGGASAALTATAAPALAAFPAAPAAIPCNANDARLAVLAGRYRRAEAALRAWIDRAERRCGPLGYIEPEYRGRYDALCAREDRLFAELVRARPDSIAGLAIKLRGGLDYDHAGVVPRECDGRLLAAMLDDLDRLAAETP